MNSRLPTPADSTTFERIKRVSAEGHESWSTRDLARVLEYLNFRNFEPVIQKAKEACVQSGHAIGNHFAEMRNMVSIGSGAQRQNNRLEHEISSLSSPNEERAGVRSRCH